MDNPVEAIRLERGRMREVRTLLAASVDCEQADRADFIEFYIAVAAYLKLAMSRLHAQDVLMLNTLRRKLEMNPGQTAIIAEVEARLAGNQRHLSGFLAAADQLRRSGRSAVPEFAVCTRAYNDYINTNMGHHAPSTDLARANLELSDWQAMAHFSQSERMAEQKMYDEVQALQPVRK